MSRKALITAIIPVLLSSCHTPAGAAPTSSSSSEAGGSTVATTAGPTTVEPTTGDSTAGDSTTGDSTETTTGGAAIGCPDAAWALPDYTRRLGFKVGAQSEELVDFPLLVVLPAEIDGSPIDPDDAEFLFFVDADGQVLPHDFESTPVAEGSPAPDCAARPRNVWVKTTLRADADTCLYLYFAPGPVAQTNTAAAGDVWSADFSHVWHVDAKGVDPWSNLLGTGDDVTCNQGDQQVGCYESMDITWVDRCLNDSACRHVGSGEHIGLYLDAGLPTPGTLSFWWNHWQKDASAIGLGALTLGQKCVQATCQTAPELTDGLANGNFYFGTRPGPQQAFYAMVDDQGTPAGTAPGAWGTHAYDEWHNVVILRSDGGLRFCVDGVCLPEITISGAADVIDMLCFGGSWNGNAMVEPELTGNAAFLFDEIQISTVVRPDAWVAAAYANRICPGSPGRGEPCEFVTFAAPESGP